MLVVTCGGVGLVLARTSVRVREGDGIGASCSKFGKVPRGF